MSFRERQLYKGSRCCHVLEIEDKILESGKMKKDLVNQGEKKLPDPELFDLAAQIKAGVDMEEVNSKVLSSKSVNADLVVRKYTKKEKSDVSTDN